MAWLGELIGTAVAGPGATVIGDPALTDDNGDAEEPTPAWMYRCAAVGILLLVLLAAGAAWQLAAGIGAVGLMAVLLDAWRRRHRVAS